MIATVTGDVSIQVNKLPGVSMKSLARTINESAERFFKDPKNLAEFEAWHAGYLAGKGRSE